MTATQILLLEDDPADRELIETTLRKHKVTDRVISLAERQAFVDALENESIDLILSDYDILPEFNGLEALALAKARYPNIPFILVSGVLGEEQAVDALKQGADDYILKQRMQRLIPAITRSLQEAQLRQERQIIAKTLKKTDNLLRAIVNASPTSILTLGPDQRVITWNKAAEQLYGWPASRVVGHTLPIIPEEERIDFNWCFRQVLRNQEVVNQENQHVTRDRHLIDVNVSLAPLQDNDQRIYGAVMTVIDITERKQIEAARQRDAAKLKKQAYALAMSNEILLQAKQDLQHHNQDLQQFAASVSHDLKAPLRGIDNLSTWITEDYADQLSPEAQYQLGLLRQRVGRMMTLIDGLLELAQAGQAQASPELVDVGQLLLDVAELLTLPVGISIRIAPNLPVIRARRFSLQQVFANLISNAIKHNPRPNATVMISVVAQEQVYEFSVADNGPGIAPENHQRVFNVFQTLKADEPSAQRPGDRTAGIGIGLALVKRLVEVEGGKIWLESQLDCGATFRFTWPISPKLI